MTCVLALALLLAWGQAVLEAQSELEDPRLAAVSWVLDESGLGYLGDSLVIDTAMGPQPGILEMTPVPLPGHAVRNRIGIAGGLGARTGTLREHLQCPGEPPSAETLAREVYHGCRLVGGAVAVIEVGEPRSRDQGVVVDVVTRYFKHHSVYEDYYGVLTTFREVLLERAPGGGWKVKGVLRKGMGFR